MQLRQSLVGMILQKKARIKVMELGFIGVLLD
jgi:hypothetical protein